MARLLACLGLLVAPLLVLGQAPAQEWGDLKGQVVFEGGGGAQWAFVALVDPKNPIAAIPVHPLVKQTLPKKVALDTPGMYFQPHALGVVEGQAIEVKNTSENPHNVVIEGDARNPRPCQIVPPGKAMEYTGWKATTSSLPVADTIFPQMKSWVRVYAHPYFAVTDDKGNWEIKNAPAGKWNLVIWHEGQGYGPGGKMGTPIVVAPGKMTDAGLAKIQ
jgi:hypothetical protein